MVFPVEPNYSRDAKTLLVLTNQARAEHGLGALLRRDSLDLAAQWMAKDMWLGKHINHEDRKGRTAIQRAVHYGFPPPCVVGENLFKGYPTTPQRVLDSWMSSPDHRDNILNGDFMYAGVGELLGNYVTVYGWFSKSI